MEDKTSGNTAVEAAETTTAPVKKTAKPKSKAQKAKSSHPPTSEMVNAAIKELKDRKGSSLQAIKKYVVSTYKVDGDKVTPFIKRYLKTAVTSGTVVQTKGKGASGSFKLAAAKTTEGKTKVQRPVRPKAEAQKAKKSVEKKTTAAQIRKSPAAKKASQAKKPAEESPKKAAASPKKPAARTTAAKAKAAAAAEAKAMPKAKKAVKAPAAKTRTPKPKKATATKAAKASAKK